jgi:glycosyltransferase involved in cell wall biosynthesis
MTISVVTASFNQGKYLEETIQSVITQQGDFFIDYIVMDGGSTDNSVDLLRKYDTSIRMGEFELHCLGIEFRWVSEKDRGQTHAINKGFQIAKGDILSWINSDDLYYDNAFSTVAEHFKKHPENDFLFGDGDVINETGDLQWEWLSRPYNFDVLKGYHYLWNEFTNYIMQQATFWRRNIFESIGLLDESLHYAMDIEYWLRIGKAGFKSVHIPEKLGKFRMAQGTKSLSSPMVFWPEQLEVFRRYNGAKTMEPFLRYYFYNEGLHNELNLDELKKKKSQLLNQWNHLDPQEVSVLDCGSKKALINAYFMHAYEAVLNGENKKANSLHKKAIAQGPWHLFSYLSLWFLFSKLLGTSLSKHLRKFAQRVIHEYRMRKYLYRYL